MKKLICVPITESKDWREELENHISLNPTSTHLKANISPAKD